VQHCLVGSEMCIRDSVYGVGLLVAFLGKETSGQALQD
jgi:hypothetical protein